MLASGRVGINAVLVGFWGALSTVAVKTVRFLTATALVKSIEPLHSRPEAALQASEVLHNFVEDHLERGNVALFGVRTLAVAMFCSVL
jgi:hypothetical protein